MRGYYNFISTVDETHDFHFVSRSLRRGDERMGTDGPMGSGGLEVMDVGSVIWRHGFYVSGDVVRI